MAFTPDYEFFRNMHSSTRLKTKEMARLLGFQDNPGMFEDFLSAEPQALAWTEFNQDYFTALLAQAQDPTRPYRGIGDDGGNYKRPNILNTARKAATAFQRHDPEYCGEIGSMDKNNYSLMDHYMRFICYIVSKNRQEGCVWENEVIDDSPNYYSQLVELCRVAYLVLDYKCGKTLYNDRDDDEVGEDGGAGDGGAGDGGAGGGGNGGAGAGAGGGGGDGDGDGGEGEGDDDGNNGGGNNRQAPRPHSYRRAVGGGRANGSSGHGRRPGGRDGSGQGSGARGSRGVGNLSRIQSMRQSNTPSQSPAQSRASTPRSAVSGRASSSVKTESGVKREGLVANVIRQSKIKKEHGMKKELKIKIEPH